MPQAVIGALRVNLSANTAEFNRGMTAAERRAMQFGRQMTQLTDRMDSVGRAMQRSGAAMSAFITAPLVLFGRQAVNAAVDAEELQSAFDYSFGAMSDDMNDWAVATGDALGRSTQAMQQMAFTFNMLFKQAAPTHEVAAQMSRDFTVLAQDLASFYNVAEGDALQKLRAGLVGEAEPLRAFGVFLSAAAVEAQAFAMGLGTANGELSEQEKILARAAIIMQQTADAQGDLERTADSAANQQRRLQAEFQELSVTVGQIMLPVVQDVVEVLQDVVEWFSNLSPEMQRTIVVSAAVAAAMGPLLLVVGSLTRGLALLTAGVAAFYRTLGPVGIAIGVISAAAAVLMGRQHDTAAATDAHTAALNDLSVALGTATGLTREQAAALIYEKQRALDAAEAELVLAEARREAAAAAFIPVEGTTPEGGVFGVVDATEEADAYRDSIAALRAEIEAIRNAPITDGVDQNMYLPTIIPPDADLQRELDALDRSLMTAEERLRDSYHERQRIVRDAFEAGLIDETEARDRLLALQAEYQDGLSELAESGGGARLDALEDFAEQELALEKAKQDELNAIARAGAEQRRRDMRSAVSSWAAVLGDLSRLIESEGEKQFRVAKGLAIAEALINVAQSVTKTFAQYGATPWGFAAAAAAASAGAVQIAAIRRQQPNGGGGVTSPGGGPTGGGSGGGGALNQTLHVEGISTSQLYSGGAVRELAERLLQYQRDGGKVTFEG